MDKPTNEIHSSVEEHLSCFWSSLIKNKSFWDSPGGSVVQWFHLPMQMVWVQSLVGELRFHMLHCQKPKHKIEIVTTYIVKYCNKSSRDFKNCPQQQQKSFKKYSSYGQFTYNFQEVFFFNWSIFYLQCVNFCWTAKWFRNIYIYIYIFFFIFFPLWFIIEHWI